MGSIVKGAAIIVGAIVVAAVIVGIAEDDTSSRSTRTATPAARTVTTVRESPPPPPAPSPSPAQTVTGRGQGVKTITLKEGRYMVNAEIRGNRASHGASHFSIVLEDQAGYPELIANEIASSWNGSTAVTVGGLFAMEPGTIVVEVSAEASAQWTVEITPIR